MHPRSTSPAQSQSAIDAAHRRWPHGWPVSSPEYHFPRGAALGGAVLSLSSAYGLPGSTWLSLWEGGCWVRQAFGLTEQITTYKYECLSAIYQLSMLCSLFFGAKGEQGGVGFCLLLCDKLDHLFHPSILAHSHDFFWHKCFQRNRNGLPKKHDVEILRAWGGGDLGGWESRFPGTQMFR